MNEQEARLQAAQLLAISDIVVVTTMAADGFPQTRAMFNLRNCTTFPTLTPLFASHQDDFTVYFSTNSSSSKVAQIKANPAVSVYYSRPDEWRGLMLGGTMEIVDDPAIKHSLWQPGWELYYPGGADDPDHTVLRLQPTAATYYHQLNNFRFEPRQAP
jgi:general stress protein 26